MCSHWKFAPNFLSLDASWWACQRGFEKVVMIMGWCGWALACMRVRSLATKPLPAIIVCYLPFKFTMKINLSYVIKDEHRFRSTPAAPSALAALGLHPWLLQGSSCSDCSVTRQSRIGMPFSSSLSSPLFLRTIPSRVAQPSPLPQLNLHALSIARIGYCMRTHPPTLPPSFTRH